jgi:hypothetical protein
MIFSFFIIYQVCKAKIVKKKAGSLLCQEPAMAKLLYGVTYTGKGFLFQHNSSSDSSRC